MTADRYDKMDAETLKRLCVTRGKPSWRDFGPGTIRDLMRDLDYDQDEIERWDYGQ